jgi:predicted MFS family arabinose efflux permease
MVRLRKFRAGNSKWSCVLFGVAAFWGSRIVGSFLERFQVPMLVDSRRAPEAF